MHNVSEQLSNANKAGVETFVAIANTTFGGFERLAALNLNAVRSLLDDSAIATRALLDAKNPQALISLQASLAQPGVEATTAYTRSVYEIASETQGALSSVVDAKISDLGKQLDTAVKTAPAGTDLAVSAVRSALSATNSAYDSMNKVIRQVADMAEANLFAATAFASRTAKKIA